MALQSNISTDMVVVEPGATAPLTIEVENNGDVDDQIEVGIEGIDGEWIAIPVPVVELKVGEKQAVKIFFKPPRTSESSAGNFPFIARVRSLTNGDTRSAQGVLTIKPYHSLTMEINPKKGFVTPTKRQNVFTVSLTNMGNSEHMIQLTADDPEEVCAFEFDDEQIVLAPGQQKDVDFIVNPKKGSPFGSTRLIGFAVTGRSLTVPSVVASAQAQLEIRPFFTPLSSSIIAVLAIVIAVFWYTQPKKPVVHLSMVGGLHKVFSGMPVSVHWAAENATSVKLMAGGEVFKDNLGPEGQEDIPTSLVGTLKIQAIAYRDNRQSDTATLDINVETAPVIPDPTIVDLKPSKTTLNKGEKFTLTYKFGDGVTRAVLSPQNTDLNLNLNSILVDPSDVGENLFEVAAYNSAGKVVKKSFKVTVVDACLAKIVKFDTDQTEVDPPGGTVNLSWQVTNAIRVELTYTNAKNPYVLQTVGSQEIQVVGDTDFKITAYDSNGKSISKTIQVKLKQPDNPPDGGVGPPTDGGGGATGATRGTTTG
ncbi:MAG: hypothetical protein JST12_05880 [Armatimonadetes bacterium]|nr:hypothetical protein [Armatimonadota bacterium]MBS1725102.1 hypothetical protein [Armatimonadota bacterium]